MNPRRNVRLYAWDRPASWWSDDKRWELVPGELNDDARWVFTRGQCHSLALALHEATGWEIVGATNYDDGVPGHVGVLSAHGVLDINGLHDVDVWVNAHGGDELTYHDAQELLDAFDGMYRKPRPAVARYWVDPVLGLYRDEVPEEALAA